MNETLRNLPRWLVWELVIPLTVLNGWLLFKVFESFQSLLTLLIAATVLSFLLNFLVEQLQQRGLSRGVSVLLIVVGALGTLAVFSLTLVPVLITQLSALVHQLPDILETGSEQFEELDAWLDVRQIPLDLSALAAQLAQLLPDELTQLPDQLLDFVVGVADQILNLVITGVLTIYLLLHGDTFWEGIFQWLPDPWGKVVQQALREQFQNYFVGQATLAALMGGLLTLAFYLLGIPFWLVFGLGIGVLVLIPFGDTVGFILVALFVSFKHIWLGGEVLLASVVTDQIIDNAIAPRILGQLVGLNPVWILISLLVGAKLAGVLGLFIAVPMAGTGRQILQHVRTATWQAGGSQIFTSSHDQPSGESDAEILSIQ